MPDVIQHTDAPGCACTGCSNLQLDLNDRVDAPVDASLDPQAGGSLNGKPILSAEQIALHLNRTGGGYIDGFNDTPVMGIQNNIGDNNSVITYGFFDTQSQLFSNGYVYSSGGSLFGLAEYFNFASFTGAQRDAARESMQAWDDLVAVSFREVSANEADINFANLASAPTTQAYSRIPTSALDATLGGQVREIGGDIWVSASQASNFRLDEGQYGIHTLTHEIGHSLGLSHPGAYNAAPGVSITYPVNAEYAQDTRAYSIMSYFEANSLPNARHFDFNVSTTAYSGVPLIHDIAAAQRIYGADMTTRTGNDVYGFNTNIVGRDTFDFVKTPAPIGAIWDAGGIDTLDTSGFATTQLIDLRAGSLSSIGGVTYDTAPSYEQVLANRAAAGITAVLPLSTYNANMAALLANPTVGRLMDNFGIAYGVTIENAIGGSGFDTIHGNEVANVLTGNAGDDVLNGYAGGDTLLGGVGSDALHGGEGDDTIDGGTGVDTMSGGTGNDLFFVDVGGDLVGELAGEGTDTVSSSISYTLGDNLENLILTGSATEGNGNGLNNVITGNALSNRLNGGAGDDRLIGGDGTDYLTGGLGNDVFVGEINTVKVTGKAGDISLDSILDFSNGDKIDLSGIDANSGLAGDQAFTLVNSANPKNAGELSIRHFGNMNAAEAALGMDLDGVDGASPFGGPVSVVFGDVDGGGADFAIVIVNSPALTTSDFMM